jgi:hypothetical protein
MDTVRHTTWWPATAEQMLLWQRKNMTGEQAPSLSRVRYCQCVRGDLHAKFWAADLDLGLEAALSACNSNNQPINR